MNRLSRISPRLANLLDRLIFVGLVIVLLAAPLDYTSDDQPQIFRLTIFLLILLFLWSVESALAGQVKLPCSSVHLVVLAFLGYGLVQLLPLPSSFASLPPADFRLQDSGLRLLFSPQSAPSLHLSVDSIATASSVMVLAMLIGYFFLVSTFINSEARIRLTIYALFACTFFIALIGARNRLMPEDEMLWRFSSGAPFGSFVNRAHFAGFAEMVIPFALALMFTRAIKRDRYVVPTFFAILLASTVFISGSRGGILVLLLQLVYLPLIAARQQAMLAGRNSMLKGGRWEIAGAAAILIGIVGGVYWIGSEPVIHEVAARFEKIEHDFRIGEAYTRPEIWRASLDMIGANPVTGVGLGAFPVAYPQYDRLNGQFQVRKAHNDYLHLAGEAGAIGVVLGLLFLILLLRTNIKGLANPNPFMRTVALGANVALFGILVHSLVDFNLQVTCNALLFLFVTSLIISSSLYQTNQKQAQIN